jgi:hypothetical protein
MTKARTALKKVQRIVVKVGTSTITYPNCSRNFARIDKLARELADLHNQGKEIILVTSGAVAVGVERLGLKSKPKTIPGKQAAAAVGQGILMNTYEKVFQRVRSDRGAGAADPDRGPGPASLHQQPQHFHDPAQAEGDSHRQRERRGRPGRFKDWR